jgi:uncharacterized small protein (DUF1192 family)
VPRSAEIFAAFNDVVAQIRATPSDEERRLRDEAAVATVRQQKLVAACAALETDIARLAAEKTRVEDGRSFAHYVVQRMQSDDYRKQLGIVSLLHRDFGTLSERLRKREGGGPPIDRIVLYIDDLDRCEEKQVVEVLQAVHLLLAFKLFVVVVAVDSRWLLRSLQQHARVFQPDAGGDQGLSEEERLHWQSTPLNYLEKIFQIPFTLRRMDPAGFENMIAHLTAPPTTTRPTLFQLGLCGLD